MKKLILLFAVLAGIFCNSQKIVNSSANTIIQGNGIVKKEIREVEKYHTIIIKIGYDIVLTNETQGKIRVVGEENINPIILTEVKNGILEIGTNPKMGYSSKQKNNKIYIPAKGINTLKVTGVSDIKSEEALEFSKLKVEIEGVANVALIGKVEDLEINMKGTGRFSGFDLMAENAQVKLKGMGDIKVFATQSFDGEVKGVGTIKVKGNPKKVSKTEKGLGRIRIL